MNECLNDCLTGCINAKNITLCHNEAAHYLQQSRVYILGLFSLEVEILKLFPLPLFTQRDKTQNSSRSYAPKNAFLNPSSPYTSACCLCTYESVLSLYTLVEASPPRASPGPPSGNAAPRGQTICWRGLGMASTSFSLTFRARKHTWLAAFLYCKEVMGQAWQVCSLRVLRSQIMQMFFSWYFCIFFVRADFECHLQFHHFSRDPFYVQAYCLLVISLS